MKYTWKHKEYHVGSYCSLEWTSWKIGLDIFPGKFWVANLYVGPVLVCFANY